MHGKIALDLVKIQEEYCYRNREGLDGKAWATQLVRQLQHITHSQWLFQNFSLHHQSLGYLWKREEKEVRQKAEELANGDPAGIPIESRYLLEIDFNLEEHTFESVSYCVLAMEAAQAAGAHDRKEGQQQDQQEAGRGQNWDIMEGKRESNRARQAQGSTKNSRNGIERRTGGYNWADNLPRHTAGVR